MSYILNALRKSEKERQARETLSLENRVLEVQEVHKPWKTWLILVLIAMNLAALSYFFWQIRQNPDPASSAPAESKVLAQASPPDLSNPGKSGKNSFPEARTEAIKLPAQKIAGRKELPISERVDQKKSLQTRKTSAPTLEEKVTTLVDVANKEGLTVLKRSEKKEGTVKTADSAKQENIGNNPSSSIPPGGDGVKKISENTRSKQVASKGVSRDAIVEETEKSPDNIQKRSSGMTTESSDPGNNRKAAPSAKRPDKKAAKREIPFIDELPVEFRRNFPDLNINVYVYSENPDESFIMVDMVKFIPGQDISEGMELKEIHHESMVVEYEGKKIQIRRP